MKPVIHVQRRLKVVPMHPAVKVAKAARVERPHLRAALEALQQADHLMREQVSGEAALAQLTVAHHELNVSSASDVYHGRRNDAIICTKRAIKALEQQPPNPDAMNLTTAAIDHVQFCLQAPIEP